LAELRYEVERGMLETDIERKWDSASTSRFKENSRWRCVLRIPNETHSAPRDEPGRYTATSQAGEIDMAARSAKLIRDKTIGKTDLTVTDLSKKLDIGRPALSNVLNGSASLSIDLALTLERNLRFECKTTAD